MISDLLNLMRKILYYEINEHLIDNNYNYIKNLGTGVTFDKQGNPDDVELLKEDFEDLKDIYEKDFEVIKNYIKNL